MQFKIMKNLLLHSLDGRSICLETDKRLTVIAGPNGVGKSTFLKGLMRDNMGSQRLPVAQSTADNNNLSPALVTPNSLSEYTIPFTHSSQTSTGSFGISYDAFLVAFGERGQQYSDRDVELIRSIATDTDRQEFTISDPEVRQNLYRKIFSKLLRPELRVMDRVFLEYHIEYSSRKYRGEDRAKILSVIGPPPWIEAQTILNSLELPYNIVVPNIDIKLPNPGSFHLRRRVDNGHVPGDRLSSGERALLSLYSILVSDHAPSRLFLFDDIDGFIHATALRKFMELLENYLNKYNCYAIWATHSPVFIQLCSSANFYLMSQYAASPDPIEKSSLIDVLSGGEFVVAENFASVFVEGKDVNFYNSVHKAIVQQGVLMPRRQVRFISPKSNKTGKDCSRSDVNDIVEVLDKSGYGDRFFGIIDLDDGTFLTHKNVYKIKRYSKENYIFDPLNVFSWCVHHDLVLSENMPRFDRLRAGSAEQLCTLSEGELQIVVDFFFKEITNHLPLKTKILDQGCYTVELRSGQKLRYPAIFIVGRGKDLKEPYNKIHKNLHEANLAKHFGFGFYWPNDLINVLSKFSMDS